MLGMVTTRKKKRKGDVSFRKYIRKEKESKQFVFYVTAISESLNYANEEQWGSCVILWICSRLKSHH